MIFGALPVNPSGSLWDYVCSFWDGSPRRLCYRPLLVVHFLTASQDSVVVYTQHSRCQFSLQLQGNIGGRQWVTIRE